MLKGLRLPSLWAATQAYLDYHQGFVKRGLLGEVLKGLGVPLEHYAAFVTVSAILFLLFAVLLLCWIRMSSVRRLADGQVVAVFGASFILTYLGHIIGYLEIPEAILAIAVLSISGTRWHLVAAAIAGVAGVLVHESYLLTFALVSVLPAFLRVMRAPQPWRAGLPLATVLLLLAATALIVARGASMTPGQVSAFQAAMTANVDFQPRGDFFPVLTRTADGNAAIMQQTLTGNGAWWLAQANAFLVFMPTTAFFLWMALRIVQGCHTAPAGRGVIKAAVVLSSLSPLTLQLVGWDIYRWYALTGFTAFLTLTAVSSHYQAAPSWDTVESRGLRNLVVLLIAVNLASGTGLFDGYRVDTFPFVDHWRALLQWITSGWHWTPPAA